jgi:hypothetical protein
MAESNVGSLVYLSLALKNFNVQQCLELTQKAAEKNKRLGITGYLHFNKGYFFQYLEGNSDQLNRLMDSIRRDNRHKIQREFELKLSHKLPIFPNWSMNFIHHHSFIEIRLEDILESTLKTFSRTNFEPTTLNRVVGNLIFKISENRNRFVTAKAG